MNYPCICGGVFKIFGGQYIKPNIRTAIHAVCDECETILPYAYNGYREISFASKDEAIRVINRFNWRRTKEIYHGTKI